MKRFYLLFLSALIVAVSVFAEEIKVDNWLVAGGKSVHKPVFNSVKSVDQKAYSDYDLLKSLYVPFTNEWPYAGLGVNILGKSYEWETKSITADSVLFGKSDKYNLIMVTAFINVDRYTKGKLKVTTNAMFDFYLDNVMKSSKKAVGKSDKSIPLNLYTGKHRLTFKVLVPKNESLKFLPIYTADKDYSNSKVLFSVNPKRTIDVLSEIGGNKIGGASLSWSGKYMLINHSTVDATNGKSTRYTEIVEVKSRKRVALFRDSKLRNMQWLPKSDKLSYIVSFKGANNLFVYDVASLKETMVAEGIKDLYYCSWSPTEDFVIYTVSKKADKIGDLKRVYNPEDRLKGYRNRSYLYKLDVNSGSTIQLTYGNLSSSLHDIHPAGDRIIFSTSYDDFTEVPFSKQNLYELNLNTNELKTIWKDKNYGGYCSYSPNGENLLVQGSSETFGKTGMNLKPGLIPNSYDQQIYIYNLNTGDVNPISKDFNPSVKSADWINNNTIGLYAADKDFVRMYSYSVKSGEYKTLNTEVECVRRASFAKAKPYVLYSGTSITTPNRLYLMDTKRGTNTLISDTETDMFSQMTFGKTDKWDFVNKQGTTITGRVYYPVGYDASKKYPVIVYYYGGTSPVDRSFGGRYPKNIWAANGYMVYVLQPSGSTGFGQDFAALHVNGWGKEAIDDIIDGTKAFLKAHPAADADNVGCMGASYGGFTTMTLQTRTDIFKTAISHAGISSISSYWGEGNWGYTYSAGASRGSYPWNNRELYVDNSPLFNADKMQNSILLLHGTSDTNVPVGESLQHYMALKLLGKKAEMVLINGEDHWVLDFKKRVEWHYTIISWFNKELKNQPQLWDEMYPEKNL